MAIISLSDAKAALGITGTARDAQITALLAGVSAMIETYAGRAFSQAAVTEYHFGGVASLPLRRYPVASIATVTDELTGSVVDSSGYEVQASTGLLRRLPWGSVWEGGHPASPFDRRFPAPEAANARRWKVAYTGGPVAAPADVQLAAFEVLGGMLKSQGGVASEKDGDYAVTFATTGGMPASAASILARYRASVI